MVFSGKRATATKQAWPTMPVALIPWSLSTPVVQWMPTITPELPNWHQSKKRKRKKRGWPRKRSDAPPSFWASSWEASSRAGSRSSSCTPSAPFAPFATELIKDAASKVGGSPWPFGWGTPTRPLIRWSTRYSTRTFEGPLNVFCLNSILLSKCYYESFDDEDSITTTITGRNLLF